MPAGCNTGLQRGPRGREGGMGGSLVRAWVAAVTWGGSVWGACSGEVHLQGAACRDLVVAHHLAVLARQHERAVSREGGKGEGRWGRSRRYVYVSILS